MRSVLYRWTFTMLAAICVTTPASASELLPPGHLMLSSQPDAWMPYAPQPQGWATFYCLLSPPQVPAHSVSFGISAGPDALWYVESMAAGLADLDPSYDGFQLTRAAECDATPWPTVLLELRVIYLNGLAGLIQLLPPPGTTTFPPRPSYRTCEPGPELPLLLGPKFCDERWEGVLLFSSCGGVITWPAIQKVHTGINPATGTATAQGVFTLERIPGYHYEETSCHPLPPTVSIRFTSTWDATTAEMLAIEPAPQLPGWTMDYSVAPGVAHVSLAANGMPPIDTRETPLARFYYRSNPGAGVSGILTTIDEVRTPAGVACAVRGTEGQFRSGCVSTDVRADGRLDVGDAVLAQRILGGTLVPGYDALCAADLDGNLAIEQFDVFALLDAILAAENKLDGPSARPADPLLTAAVETVHLSVDPASGLDVRLQLDPARQQVIAVTSAAGSLRWRDTGSGLGRVVLSDAVSAARTLTLQIESTAPGAPARLVGLQGFDEQGVAFDVGFQLEGAVVPAPALRTPPATSRLLPAAPNPFNPRTMLRFVVARSGPVRLSIHDAAGRVVRSYARMWLEAGPHEVPWDGRDDSGHPAASGVYRLRLVAPDGIDRQRSVVLLR